MEGNVCFWVENQSRYTIIQKFGFLTKKLQKL